MLRYIGKRLALMLPALFGVAVLTFVMLRILPGDVVVARLYAETGSAPAEVVAQERKRLGLDKPLPAQFLDWMAGMATFDLGTSMWTNRPIREEIGIRIGLSLQVAFMATLIAVLVAIPLGTLSAIFRNSPLDYFVRMITIAGLAVPSFWLGMMLILGLLTLFRWSPPVTYTAFYVDPWANMAQLIWPALAVGYRYAAVVARMVRSSVIEVLREDYIRTARAKGVYERLVISRHALRNALLPAITVIGLEFAFLIGGLVVTEQVFNLNGVGRLFVEAVARHDYTMIQALVMMTAILFALANLAVDIIYGLLDPRLRTR